MAIRRIGKRELARGWVAWHDGYVEAVRIKRALLAAGTKLLRPHFVACFQGWRREAEAARLERKSMSIGERLQAEANERQQMQREMQAEIDKLKADLNREREAALEGRGLENEMQRQLEERMAKEKEKRVEHTKEMAIRRIGKRDLARGWVAWSEMYLEKRRRHNLLKNAGNKLGRPKLTASFSKWFKDWESEEMRKFKKQSMTVEERLREQLVQAKEELARMKKDMAYGAGAEEEAARLMEEKLAAEKEKRIAHTQEMAIRRIGKRDLTLGWMGWLETYQEAKRIQRTLQKSTAKLTKPRMVASFQLWHNDWAAEETRRARVLSNTQTGRAAREAADTKAELEHLRAELEALRLATREGNGMEVEAQRQLESELAAERAVRIDHTKEMAIRRIVKRDLARGWVAWHGKWAEEARRGRLLKQAALKLTKPHLFAAYRHWRSDWETEELEKRKMTCLDQVEVMKQERDKALRELHMVRHDLDTARQAMQTGRGLESERERLMEEKMEREREKRIAHTQQMAVLRIGKRDLARGWMAWLTPYLEKKKNLRKLQQAGARLVKPKLAKSFQLWQRLALAEKARKSNMTVEEMLLAAGEEREELKVSLTKVQRELKDQRTLDEVALAESRQAESNLQKQVKELMEALASEKKTAILANSQMEHANESVKQKEAKIAQEQALLKDQQKQAKDHLEVQLAELRKPLDKELKGAQNTIAKLREEIARLMADKQRQAQLGGARLDESASPTPADVPTKQRKKSTSILGDVDFDEERPLGEQLREALSKHAIRVLDLFRNWDENGDGEVSRKEFRRAMPALGMDLPVDVIDDLFDQYDPDKSGSIEFKEMQKMLSGRSSAKPASKKIDRVSKDRPGTAGSNGSSDGKKGAKMMRSAKEAVLDDTAGGTLQAVNAFQSAGKERAARRG